MNCKASWCFQGVEKGWIESKWVHHIFRKYKLIHVLTKLFNPFMHNVKKWPNILEIFYGAHTGRF